MMKKTVKPEKRQITSAHIIQSAMASIYILLVFWIMNLLHSELAVASLGASAFIVFSFPNSQASRPRFLIGGYCIGALSGFLCGWFSMVFKDYPSFPAYIPACAMAVFLSMLLMAVLDFEHPPSVALAVAVTMNQNPLVMAVAGLGCILVLCILKELLKKHLLNL